MLLSLLIITFSIFMAGCTVKGGSVGDPATYIVSGYVLLSNGSPAPNTYVQLVTVSGSWTDPSGYYKLTGIPGGTYSLNVYTDCDGNWILSYVGSVDVSGNLILSNIILDSVIGHVQEPDGTPVANAQVTLWSSGTGNAVVDTDSSGIYLFTGMPNGTYTLNIYAPPGSNLTNKQENVIVSGDTNLGTITLQSSILVAPTISPSPGTVIQGQTSALTSTAVSTGTGPYTYQWLEKAPGGSYVDVGLNSASFNFVTSGATATGVWGFMLQVTDSTGAAVNSTAVSVTVDSALVAPSVTSSPGTVDRGQTSVLSSSAVTTGSGGYTYEWFEKVGAGSYSLIGGATLSSYSFVTSVSTATGSWSFMLQVTDSIGAAVNSTAATVTVNAAPSVSVSPAGPLTLDTGQSQTFTATGSGGSGTIHYQWYLGSSAVGTNSNSYVFSQSAGSYTVSCKVTDSAPTPVTSPTSNVVSITVNSALAAPTVTPALGIVDQGQTSSLTSSVVTTGSSPYAYQWFEKAPSGNYVTVGSDSASFNFATSSSTATGTWAFKLQVTDSTGAAVNSTAATVTVNSAPSVSISPGSWTMDVGQSTTFTAAASGGSGTYTNYQWYANGQLAQSGSVSTMTWGSPNSGAFSITVKVTDSYGVTSVLSSAAAVTVNSALAAPTVTATPATVDQGQTSALSSSAVSTGTSPYTYQWLEKAPGGSYVTAGTNSASFSFVTTGSTATGVWSFELQVTDNAGASVNSTAASVTVSAVPTVSIAPVGPLSMDVGQVQAFTATPSGGSGALSYQWYLDGSAVGSNSASYSYTAALGSHSVTCKVTDSASTPVTSAASNAVAITVYSALAAPTASASPSTIDQGQTSSLTSSSVTTGTSPYTYQWFEKASGGSYATVGRDSASFSFATSGSTATGTYSFILQVTDSTGAAVNSTAASVLVNAPPAVSVSPAGPVTMDVGQSQTFTATGSGGSGTLSYQWYVDGSPVGTNSASYSYTAAAGSHSVTCKVTDSAPTPVTSPASNAVSITVNSVLTAPTVTPWPSTVDQCQTAALSSSAVTTGTSPYIYQWFEKAPGGIYITVGTNSASFSFVTSGSTATGTWGFILQVTDSVGASVNSTSAAVTVNPTLAAPTVTPNPSTVTQGLSSCLSCKVTTGTSPYTYQWFEQAPGGSYVTVGTNSASFNCATCSSTTTGTWNFKLQVTDSSGQTVTSNVVTVTVQSSIFVTPESTFGALSALSVCFTALIVCAAFKSKLKKQLKNT
jgi:hypothetical protein